jgi:hypothetical protein
MSDAVLTTVKGEVLYQSHPPAKLTTVKAEVLHSNTYTSTGSTARRRVVVVVT